MDTAMISPILTACIDYYDKEVRMCIMYDIIVMASYLLNPRISIPRNTRIFDFSIDIQLGKNEETCAWIQSAISY